MTLFAQPERWQQRVDYQMDINFDAEKHQFDGMQRLVYTNNSPDKLKKIYYHLYLNAFQPGSMMDVRSLNIEDPDRRVRDRISELSPKEIGYHKILSLKQNGIDVDFKIEGTILEVTLNEAIQPSSTTRLDMKFKSQVPVQIRRNGRNNSEGIDYSMAQWYPKLCEYDYQGWHANPYIGREFYGVWGNFDVTIHMDKKYVVAATGYLQNPNEIGHGYEDEGVSVKHGSNKLSWNFFAPNVHDFVWAADPEYKHTKMATDDGVMMHFFFKENEKTRKTWKDLPATMKKVFAFANKTYGKYPYKKYSFIQGGDGGMEYPMATLIMGEGSNRGLVGVSVHELMHSWYQMILGTNESLYAWMDEGFTSFASSEISNHLTSLGVFGEDAKPSDNPFLRTYLGFMRFAASGKEEALSTHSDHYNSNSAYGTGAYTKGSLFLNQLRYVMGESAFREGMLNYYTTWKFKHPNVNDFIRVMEKTADMELDWYKEYMVNTTHTVDYGFKEVVPDGDKTKVILARIGKMPMPIDVEVTYTDGQSEVFYAPLRIMRGEKKHDKGTNVNQLPDWPWTHPDYEFTISKPASQISKIEIDPSMKMLDADRKNNGWSNTP
jgi:hypothetical protein